MGGGGSSLDKLLKAWGIQFDTGKVVADLKYKMQLRGRNGEPQEAPAWLALTADGINKDDVATSQIDNIWLPLCGAFTGTPVAGLKETVLLQQLEGLAVGGWHAGQPLRREHHEGVQALRRELRAGDSPDRQVQDRLPGWRAARTRRRPEARRTRRSRRRRSPPIRSRKTKGDNTVVLFGDADMLFDRSRCAG